MDVYQFDMSYESNIVIWFLFIFSCLTAITMYLHSDFSTPYLNQNGGCADLLDCHFTAHIDIHS